MFPLHKAIGEAATICPYCSCGCGLLIATGADGHIVNSEGDPDAINNRGALDPKSISVRSLSQSDRRLNKPLYRAPGSDKFEEVEWDWAIEQVAKRIKETRDATFEKTNARWRDRQPHPGDRFHGRRGQQRRGVLPGHQAGARPGPGVYRTSGSHMTLRHGGRSGHNIRAGCHDQSLG